MNKSIAMHLRILTLCGARFSRVEVQPESKPEPELTLSKTVEQAYDDVMAHMDDCSGCAAGPLNCCQRGQRLMEHWAKLKGIL